MVTGGCLISRFDAPAILQWLEARRWKVLAVTLPVVLLLHFSAAAVTVRKSNLDWRPSDQFAEVYLANAARGDVVPLRTDGVRHPLWSWTVGHLAGHLYVEGEEKEAFFTRGKWINGWRFSIRGKFNEHSSNRLFLGGLSRCVNCRLMGR